VLFAEQSVEVKEKRRGSTAQREAEAAGGGRGVLGGRKRLLVRHSTAWGSGLGRDQREGERGGRCRIDIATSDEKGGFGRRSRGKEV